MSGGQLNADVDRYLQAATMNTPPPQIMSDPLVAGATPIEQLLRVLGLAANLSDSQDNLSSTELHAERDARTREAAQSFTGQDDEAAAELAGIDPDPFLTDDISAGDADQAGVLIQQLPQLASGLAGAVAGALGGALQPLAQLPQQAAQGMQQALQTGIGLIDQAADPSVEPSADSELVEAPVTDDFGFETQDVAELPSDAENAVGAGASGGGPGLIGGTAPMSYLGPPPVPSAGTSPSAGPVAPASASPATAAPAPAGMTGMPMVPPNVMGSAAGAEREAKAETKRVSVPPVRNGAPVQGRLTVPPAATPVTENLEGKPVVTRRIERLGTTAKQNRQ